MTVGDKIKKIRTFRGMTQKELGLAIGFEEKGADNRIAQYETNYRVPKRELLDKMAEALRVDRQNFYTIAPGSAEDFMRTFFWLDEDSPGSIRLFQLVRNPGKIGASEDQQCPAERDEYTELCTGTDQKALRIRDQGRKIRHSTDTDKDQTGVNSQFNPHIEQIEQSALM